MNAIETRTTTRTVAGAESGPVDVTFTERGEGRPFFILHGGAGPQSVTGFADLLAGTKGVRVITPTHPGFNGTPRPSSVASPSDLADLYLRLIDDMDLRNVTVIGNSIGGWITAEMALRHSDRISSFILVDSMGIVVGGHPVVDFFSLNLDEVAQHSFFDPEKFRIDPSALPPEARAAMAGNRETLAVYGGGGMADPTLLARVSGIAAPTLVIWGEADRIADPGYGRAYADAIPGAEFTVLPGTGHVPQLESPDALLAEVWDFAGRHFSGSPAV